MGRAWLEEHADVVREFQDGRAAVAHRITGPANSDQVVTAGAIATRNPANVLDGSCSPRRTTR